MKQQEYDFIFSDRLPIRDVRVQSAFRAVNDFHDSYLIEVKSRFGYLFINISDIYFVSNRQYNVNGVKGAIIYLRQRGDKNADEIEFFSSLAGRDVYNISVDDEAQEVAVSLQEVYDLKIKVDLQKSAFRWKFLLAHN